MTDKQVLDYYGQKKMDIIYGRMTAKEMRVLLYSMIRGLPADMQPPLLDQLSLAIDAEVKDFAIKTIEDMGA